MPSKVPLGCPNPTIPLMSLTIPHAPNDMYELPRQFLINLMISHFPWVTNIMVNGWFHRNPSISHTAHNKSSNKWVQVPATAFKSSTSSTCGQQHRSKNSESDFPCHKWLVPFPRFPMYSKMTGSNSSNFNVWLVPFPQFSNMTDNVQVMVVSPSWPPPPNGLSIQTGSSQVMWFLRPDRHSWMASPPRLAAPRWCDSSAQVITAEWRLHSDWQHPGYVVPPIWPSQLNGHSTQTGNTQVMWFLRSDRHSGMASPPRLAAPRWCGSSARVITAEWRLHSDWQHPGDVVPPLWPSQLNGLSTQTGSTQVMWFLRSDRHSWMVSPPRLVMPRWCGSSALTITAEWLLHPYWPMCASQHRQS